MLFGILADILVLAHFSFIVFVVLGGLLLFRWRWLIWVHLPAVIWGAAVEFFVVVVLLQYLPPGPAIEFFKYLDRNRFYPRVSREQCFADVICHCLDKLEMYAFRQITILLPKT